MAMEKVKVKPKASIGKRKQRKGMNEDGAKNKGNE